MARKAPDKAYEWHCRECKAMGRYTSKRPMPTRWCTACGSSKISEREIPYGRHPSAGGKP